MRTCLQAIQTMLPNLIGNPATGITQSVGSPRSHSGAKSSTHIVYGPPEMRVQDQKRRTVLYRKHSMMSSTEQLRLRGRRVNRPDGA